MKTPRTRGKSAPPRTPHDARKYFLSAIIADAVRAASGGRKASEREREECMDFLQSDKCARWVDHLDINPDTVTDFVSSLRRMPEPPPSG